MYDIQSVHNLSVRPRQDHESWRGLHITGPLRLTQVAKRSQTFLSAVAGEPYQTWYT